MAESGLADFTDNANETTEFAFRAPEEGGEYSWTIVFPKHEAEGLVHGEGSLPITVNTMAHDTRTRAATHFALIGASSPPLTFQSGSDTEKYRTAIPPIVIKAIFGAKVVAFK